MSFLSRHKHSLAWFHIAITLFLAVGIPLWIRFSPPFSQTTYNLLVVFFSGLIGFCQNIGIMHEFAHRLPTGPKRVGFWLARLMHSLGGLKFHRARLAHRFHHQYLGTEMDPDRLGYRTTTTLFDRVKYLLFIGPIRARYAPVDLEKPLSTFSPTRRSELEQLLKGDRFWLFAVHGCLLLVLQGYYLPLFGSLLTANLLSNIREVTEHGDFGGAAYVNIRPSFLGVLFFSTPGFWFHGSHHMYPHIHYLELPEFTKTMAPKDDYRFLKRTSYLKYICTGT